MSRIGFLLTLVLWLSVPAKGEKDTTVNPLVTEIERLKGKIEQAEESKDKLDNALNQLTSILESETLREGSGADDFAQIENLQQVIETIRNESKENIDELQDELQELELLLSQYGLTSSSITVTSIIASIATTSTSTTSSTVVHEPTSTSTNGPMPTGSVTATKETPTSNPVFTSSDVNGNNDVAQGYGSGYGVLLAIIVVLVLCSLAYVGYHYRGRVCWWCVCVCVSLLL